MRYCECGCGQIVKNRFVCGHYQKVKNYDKTIKPKYFCECGCGQEMNSGRRFIPGHNMRIEEARKKLSEIKTGNQNCYIDGRCNKLKEWQINVKERDNYTCQICSRKNLKGKNCHAHHIKSKEDFPEAIYDLNNGITLCCSCHTSIHMKDKLVSEKTKKKQSESQKKYWRSYHELYSLA